MIPEFRAYGKTLHVKKYKVIVTEKIDGTNGVVHISPEGVVTAGSRNRWLTVEKDNYNFAKWVQENAETLKETLGQGYHYGEWAGKGIQGRYKNAEQRSFFLFDTLQYSHLEGISWPDLNVVPTILTSEEGMWSNDLLHISKSVIARTGSYAYPKQPAEGVVLSVYRNSGALEAPKWGLVYNIKSYLNDEYYGDVTPEVSDD